MICAVNVHFAKAFYLFPGKLMTVKLLIGEGLDFSVTSEYEEYIEVPFLHIDQIKAVKFIIIPISENTGVGVCVQESMEDLYILRELVKRKNWLD